MAKTSCKTVTVQWEDKKDGTADISFDTKLSGNDAAQVLLGGLLALLGIEDHEAVKDVVRTLNKYSSGGGVTHSAE